MFSNERKALSFHSGIKLNVRSTYCFQSKYPTFISHEKEIFNSTNTDIFHPDFGN